MFINHLAAVTFAALSVAMPVSNDEKAPLLPREEPIDMPTPENVPKPPAGHCAMVVLSAAVLPIGGQPTTVSGDGIAPSQVNNPIAGVINTKGEVVGAYRKLDTHSPGFSASIQLDPKKINDGEAIEMTADFIDPARDYWGIKWSYKDQHQDCKDICSHTDVGDGLKTKAAATAFFKC